jgi:UDP-N-acetylmuramoyl-tripeptide--D-alanyl-D-alanine ligase
VTGSVGKTTTKTFLKSLLKDACASKGNQNSQIGLPLSLINESGEKGSVYIAEMGISYPSEMEKLVAMAIPKIAIITNITWVHGENFGSLAAIAKEKCKIASSPKTEKVILPSLCVPYLPGSFKGQIFTFSLEDPDADYYLKQEGETCALFKRKELFFEFLLPKLSQPAWLENLAAVLACIDQLHIPLDGIRDRLSFLEEPLGRYQFIKREGVTFIDDAYNACLRSFQAAFKAIPTPSCNGRKIAVIAPMVEQGEKSEENHTQVLEEALKSFDVIFCLGRQYVSIYNERNKEKTDVYFYESFDTLIVELKKKILRDDIVLLKGSCKYALGRTIDALFPL